jgi:putative phage-type endonuclease
MLTIELFLKQDSRGETPLHVAARKGTLYQVPEEFLTPETLSVMESYGRTPLHVAAAYSSLSQIPRDVLTPELLAIKTANPHRSSVVHVAARNNALSNIPGDLLTPELMAQTNAYGETPILALEHNRATPSQLAYLQHLGVEVDAGTLMKHEASELIDQALQGNQPGGPPPIDSEGTASPEQFDVESGCFTIVNLSQGTPEWHDWRNGGIGASDAPTIMGENPWRASAALLLEKLAMADIRGQNAAMARGTELEPEARQAYTARTGKWVRPACLQSTEYEWLRASVDGLTHKVDAVVEIKCGKSVYRRTSEHGRVPDYYYGQLQHILAVTGLMSIDFWCYLPGFPSLLLTVNRDDEYIVRLLHAEYNFWTEVLQRR